MQLKFSTLKMANTAVTIRSLSEDELEAAYALTLDQNWTITMDTYKCIHLDKPQGILGAFTSSGQIIGNDVNALFIH